MLIPRYIRPAPQLGDRAFHVLELALVLGVPLVFNNDHVWSTAGSNHDRLERLRLQIFC